MTQLVRSGHYILNEAGVGMFIGAGFAFGLTVFVYGLWKKNLKLVAMGAFMFFAWRAIWG